MTISSHTFTATFTHLQYDNTQQLGIVYTTYILVQQQHNSYLFILLQYSLPTTAGLQNCK